MIKNIFIILSLPSAICTQKLPDLVVTSGTYMISDQRFPDLPMPLPVIWGDEGENMSYLEDLSIEDQENLSELLDEIDLVMEHEEGSNQKKRP